MVHLYHGPFGRAEDQLLINEYKPGQGIGAHVDSTTAFKDHIVSITLNAFTLMRFTHTEGTYEAKTLTLTRRSALVLSGPARYDWKHGIKGSKEYGTRVSLTFRKVIL